MSGKKDFVHGNKLIDIKEKKSLYRLTHIHHNNGYKQELYIGTFDSKDIMKKAILHLMDQPGFNKFSIDSFIIDKIILDQIYWENGFYRLFREIDIPL